MMMLEVQILPHTKVKKISSCH